MNTENLKSQGLAQAVRTIFFTLILLLPSFAKAQEAGDGVTTQEYGKTDTATRTILVLDGSNSMWGEIDGRHKIEIAREVAQELVTDFSADLKLGLMAYGHRREADCEDIELLFAPASGQGEKIKKAIAGITPRGKTPLAASVRLAGKELGSHDEPGSIILVTDGLESCGGDLDALARDLAKKGLALQVNIIGFDLANQDTSSLRELAKATGGLYLGADDAEQLRAAMKNAREQVEKPTMEKQPETPTGLRLSATDAEGKTLGADVQYAIYARGSEDPLAELKGGKVTQETKAGIYSVTATYSDLTQRADLEVKKDALTEHEFHFAPASLSLKLRMGEDTQVITSGATWYIYPAEDGKKGKEVAKSYEAQPVFQLAPGDYLATVRYGDTNGEAKLTLGEGQQLEHEIVLGAGVLAPVGYFTKDGEELTDSKWVVYHAAKDLQGQRSKAASSYDERPEFSLPAGDYLVTLSSGETTAQDTVTVESGQRVEPKLSVEGGLLHASATYSEGGEALSDAKWVVYKAAKNLKGDRIKAASSYDETPTWLLPAGDYYIVVTSGHAEATGTFPVKAGASNDAKLALGAGILLIETTVAEGGTRNSGAQLTVAEAKKDISGKHRQIEKKRIDKETSLQLTLPVGTYRVTVTNGEAGETHTEAEVKAGERSEVSIELPAASE